MTYSQGSPGYPPSQGSPGYPPAQPPPQYGAPARPAASTEAGPSKLPAFLGAGVTLLGLAVYLANFGPSLNPPQLPGVGGSFPAFAGFGGVDLGVIAGLLAGLLAGASLLPKQKNVDAVVAAVSIVGFLLVLGAIINKPDGWSVGWGLILVVVFAALQAVSAVGSLLLDAGVIAPPAPRPKYDQSQYGAYGPPAGYYGPPAGQSGQQPPYPGPPQHQPAQQQRPPYPQYGGYPPAPSTGGFGAQGPPTPPTGFPSFSPPQQSSAPTGQIPAQSAEQPQASESTPS